MKNSGLKNLGIKAGIFVIGIFFGPSIVHAWQPFDMQLDSSLYIDNIIATCVEPNLEPDWRMRIYYGSIFNTSEMVFDTGESGGSSPCSVLGPDNYALYGMATSGDYWVGVTSADGDYYAEFNWDNDTSTVIDLSMSTTSRITSMTVATSSKTVTVQGYWNVHASSNQSERLSFWQESTAYGQESFLELTATSSGAFSLTFDYLAIPNPSGSTTPVTATTLFKAELTLVDTNYYDPFGTNGLNSSLYRTVLDTEEVSLTELTHTLDTPRGLAEYPEFDCSWTSLSGCIKNAGIWLAYPSTENVDRFKSLSEDMKGRFPFAYAYGMNTLRTELFASTQTATSTIGVTVNNFGTIEFLSKEKMEAVPYASTVRTILAWLLWLLAVEYIYYRVIRSHDNNTPA